MLQPLYTQVACEYADLHDHAGRMKAVGAVRESLLEKKSVRDNRNDQRCVRWLILFRFDDVSFLECMFHLMSTMFNSMLIFVSPWLLSVVL